VCGKGNGIEAEIGASGRVDCGTGDRGIGGSLGVRLADAEDAGVRPVVVTVRERERVEWERAEEVARDAGGVNWDCCDGEGCCGAVGTDVGAVLVVLVEDVAVVAGIETEESGGAVMRVFARGVGVVEAAGREIPSNFRYGLVFPRVRGAGEGVGASTVLGLESDSVPASCCVAGAPPRSPWLDANARLYDMPVARPVVTFAAKAVVLALPLPNTAICPPAALACGDPRARVLPDLDAQVPDEVSLEDFSPP